MGLSTLYVQNKTRHDFIIMNSASVVTYTGPTKDKASQNTGVTMKDNIWASCHVEEQLAVYIY